MPEARDQLRSGLLQAEIDAILHFHPHGLISFDFEMTGLSPLFDKIIEIAAVKLSPNGELSSFHRLINPLMPIPEKTKKYHGLSNEDLRDKPTLKLPLREFAGFIKNLPMVAHNAQFDASFLFIGLTEARIDYPQSELFDSCKLSRFVFKKESNGPKDHKLSSLAKFFKIDLSHHQALDDSLACLKIYANLLILILEKKIEHHVDHRFLFKLDSFAESKHYILDEKLKGLKRIIETQETIKMKYQGGSMKGKYRKVRPIALLALPKGVILYAECLSSKMMKYFHTKKIKDYKRENDA